MTKPSNKVPYYTINCRSTRSPKPVNGMRLMVMNNRVLSRPLALQSAVGSRHRPRRLVQRCCISTVSEASFPLDDEDFTKDSTKNVHAWLVDVLRPTFQSQQPLLIRSAVSQAPAIHLWQSWDYWRDTVGHEMAKVEIGGSYAKNAEKETSQAEIPVEGYLQYLELFEERHGKTLSSDARGCPPPKQEEMVYMAQNDLFQALYKDIIVPEFCQDESNLVGLGRLYSVMLWLGPHGSVSPLHNDPLDNLLVQYVGRKRILLYPPNTQVYAGHNGHQSNTSPIEPPEAADSNEEERDEYNKQHFPLFDPDIGIACEIGPGDILYIPSKWYHHVRSLDMSASVNIWWR
jgi:hypothetical protein